MIGDHTVDIDAAKAFGCESIGVLREDDINRMDLIRHADYIVKQSEMSEKIMEIIKHKICV